MPRSSGEVERYVGSDVMTGRGETLPSMRDCLTVILGLLARREPLPGSLGPPPPWGRDRASSCGAGPAPRPFQTSPPPSRPIPAADRGPTRERGREGAKRAGAWEAPPENCRLAAVGKSA